MTDDGAPSQGNIDLALACSICFSTYKTPKHLPCCSHSFCLKCLDTLVKSDGSCWNVVSCPQCRTKSPIPFGGVRYFQTNIALQQIVEAWQSHRDSDSNYITARVTHENQSTAEQFLTASKKGDISAVVRLIRKFGRSLFSERTEEDGCTGLHVAVQFGHAQLVKTMLKFDAWIGTPDNNGNTALHYAARYGQNDIILIFIKSGFEINVAGELSRTPFLTAAAFGNASTVRLLGQHKSVNINALDKNGANAALLATWIGSITVLHELTLLAANFTMVDNFGYFPLFVAAAKGDVESVAMLLNTEAGLYVDLRGRGNQTALHAASLLGHMEVAKLLIHHKATPTVLDENGCTPLELAAQRGHYKFVYTLVEFMKRIGQPVDFCLDKYEQALSCHCDENVYGIHNFAAEVSR